MNAELQALSAQIRQGIDAGELTPGQLVGIDGEERRAVARLAQRHARRGRLRKAIALHGLLLLVDPYDGDGWAELARLQLRAGEPAAALGSFQAAELIGGGLDERSRRDEARCMHQLQSPSRRRRAR